MKNLIIKHLVMMSEYLTHTIDKATSRPEAVEMAQTLLNIIYANGETPLNKIIALRTYCASVDSAENPYAYPVSRQILTRVRMLADDIEQTPPQPLFQTVHIRGRR